VAPSKADPQRPTQEQTIWTDQSADPRAKPSVDPQGAALKVLPLDEMDQMKCEACEGKDFDVCTRCEAIECSECCLVVEIEDDMGCGGGGDVICNILCTDCFACDVVHMMEYKGH